MVQVNLIPDSHKQIVKSQRSKWFFFSAMLVAIAVLAFLVFVMTARVFFFQKRQMSDLDNKIASARGRIDNIEDLDRMVTIANNMQGVTPLLDNRLAVSRSGVFLEQTLPAGISLSSYSVQYLNDGNRISALEEPSFNFFTGPGSNYTVELSLNGGSSTPKNVNRVADTLKHAEYDYQEGETKKDRSDKFNAFDVVQVANMSINNDTQDGSERVTFEIRATMDIELFNPSLEDVQIIVPDIVSSPSASETPCVFNDSCRDSTSGGENE